MKHLGWKHTKTRTRCHQHCSICHPPTKAGRSADKKLWRREVQEHL